MLYCGSDFCALLCTLKADRHVASTLFYMKRKSRYGHYHSCSDRHVHIAVDAAIELANRSSPSVAALFLCSKGIPLQLALRLLAHPRERR